MTAAELDALPKSQWNALIAQRCGWKTGAGHGDISWVTSPTGTKWESPNRSCHELLVKHAPDYTGSLDAMAFVEATLTGGKIEWFGEHLRRIVHTDTTDDDWRDGAAPSVNTKPWHATAEQRSRAFLLT